MVVCFICNIALCGEVMDKNKSLNVLLHCYITHCKVSSEI